MLVAAGTLEPDAEEKLRGVVDLLLETLDLSVPDDRRVESGVAAGGHDRRHKAVIGHVFGQRLTDPVVEGERTRLRDRPEAPLVAEDGAPLHREQVGVLRPLQPALDPARPPVGAGARFQLGQLLGRGQYAANIEGRAAERTRRRCTRRLGPG